MVWGVVPLGFGRKIRNRVIEAMMMPAMMKNIRGLEKAGLFSGDGVGVSMGNRMPKKEIFACFFLCVVKTRF